MNNGLDLKYFQGKESVLRKDQQIHFDLKNNNFMKKMHSNFKCEKLIDFKRQTLFQLTRVISPYKPVPL